MKDLSALSHRQEALLRHLLNSSQGLTLDHLSKQLEISRNAVNQHISFLEKLNYIQSKLLPSSGGRPSRAYTLTKAGKALFPKQYALFSKTLLKAISQKLGSQSTEELLTDIGHELSLPFIEQVKSSQDPIETVRQIMEELGYETIRPANPETSQEIIAKNCVFHDVAMENDAVCQLDQALISSLIGSSIEQKECMAKGDDSCRFCIKNN